MKSADLDSLTFGTIAMTLSGIVTAYNSYESEMAGFAPEDVIGKHFFREIAPCTNNNIVAGMFDFANDVDDIIPYVFTLKGEIEEVRLRLLKDVALGTQFLLVERTSRCG
jgi:photoactive yellow protein